MMIADKQLELNQLKDISQTMLGQAEAGEWEQLADLENKRKSLLQSFFAHQVSTQDSSQVEQVIQHVLSINDKIAQLAQQEKMAIGHQLQGLKKRQTVQSAYLQNK